jgi:hypothetical protein
MMRGNLKRTLIHGNTVCAVAKIKLGYRPGQGLHCSLHDEQTQDRAHTRTLPKIN